MKSKIIKYLKESWISWVLWNGIVIAWYLTK